MRIPSVFTMAAALCLGAASVAGCGEREASKPKAPVEPAPVIEERWDFYVRRMNDRPASVALNFGFQEHAPIAGRPHLLWISLPIAEPAGHGMGSAGSATQMQAIEDALAPALGKAMDASYVGRIRGEGTWRIYFYAPGAMCLEAHVREVLKAWPDQAFDVGTQHDPTWSHYLEFLWPDAERLQWMGDNRVCGQLEKHGDVLTAKRPVDHWIYFPTEQARAAFEAATADLGFEVVTRNKSEQEEEPRPFSLNVEREDAVELEHIHGVVMQLIRAAETVKGKYDGWGCGVVKADDADK